ncbi:MAG: C40 family peptidase [Acidimicrobiaceae bacterium]|nr:C40 family peptidase [Acidimicrobiaceae bacterium]
MSKVQTALAMSQAQLVSAQVSLHQTQIAASAASARAGASLRRLRKAQAAYRSLDGEVRKAALLLYMWGGPEALAPNPTAGEAAVYANAYAESAFPIKAIATRQHDAAVLADALSAARTARKDADHDLAQARIALQTARAVQEKLQHELSSLLPNRPAGVATPATTVAAHVAAQATEVAAQAGRELTSPSALEFTPSSWLSDPVSTTAVALAWAFEELGKPYVWGGTGPNGFDCSGLTQYVWAKAGVQIPRVAVDQYTWATPVPLSQLLPGDLVFFGQTDIHHVGIYIGDGLMINAPHTGDVVRVSSIWWSDLAGFGRVHAAGVPGPIRTPPSAQQPVPEAVVPAAGPVPSQTSPPPGWEPTPGSSAPLPATTPIAPTTTTTTTTTSPPSTTGSTTTTARPTTTTTPGRSPATMMTLPPNQHGTVRGQ